MKHWIKAFLITSLWCICPAVLAAVFDVAPQDKSKEYLGIIFGGQIGSVNLGGGGNPMLSKMFERFNFIIVFFGTIVVSYVGVLSIINTAREGEALGKKFTTWMILRAVFGLLFMIPTPGTGYSLIQVFVTWIVLNGIGAANSVWEVVVNQISSGVKAVGKIDIDSNALNGRLESLTNAVFNSSICMQKLNSIPSFVSTNGAIKINVNRLPANPGSTQISATVSLGTERYKNLCGLFTVSTPWGSTEALTVKINALNAMFDTLSPAAQLVGEASCNPPECPAPGYLPAAKEAYKSQVATLVSLYASGSGAMAGAVDAYEAASASRLTAAGGVGIGTNVLAAGLNVYGQAFGAEAIPTNTNVQSGLAGGRPASSAQQRINDLKNLGWIHAGGYYYLLSKSEDSPQAQAAVEDITNSVPTADSAFTPLNIVIQNGAPVPPATGWSAGLLNSLSTTPVQQATLLNNALQNGNNYIARGYITPPSLPGFGSSAQSSGNDFIDAIFVNPFNSLQTTIINSFMKSLTGEPGGDPLKAMGKLGTGLMLSGELLPLATMIIGFFMALAVSAGACVNPMAYAGPMLINQITMLVGAVATMLWAIGATLGIYTPMIPYVIFLVTAFGWLIGVIEAIVGAPILALGMVHPSQDELGKATPGIAILANIFLRPTLMIFGFILAASLLRAGIAMLNFSFVTVLGAAVPIPSMFSIIAILALYTGLVLAIVNRSFSLIYELPNRIFRWMGGQEERHEVEKMAGEAKEQFGKGAAGGEQAAGKAHGAASKFSEDRWKGAQAKSKEKAEGGGGIKEDAGGKGGGGGGGGKGGEGPGSAPPSA